MILIVDYNMGNLCSIEKALQKVGARFKVGNNPEEFKNAKKIIMPGVGFFKKGMKNLKELGLIEPIKEHILNNKPFLGICVGMQLLFERSDEGNCQGLGIIKGEIKRFDIRNLKIPHIGWNEVFNIKNIRIMKDIEEKSNFYFVHSYHAVIDEKREDIKCGMTDYGYNFISIIEKNNIWGTQFHPEKSQDKGLHILKNFDELKC